MNDQISPVSPDRSSRSARFYSHLQRYKNLLRRRWWMIPLLVLLASGVQAYRIWNAPPSFVSLGRMIVSIKISTPTGSLTTYTEELSNFLGTQVALMQSSTVQNRASARVIALKPDLLPSPVFLQILVSPKTTIFNLKAVGSEPNYTRAYLDACMEEYINLKREMIASPTEKTLAGIMDESRRLEKELVKGKDSLLSFQSSNSVVFIQQQADSAAQYLVGLNRSMADLKADYELLKLLNLEQNLERQQKPAPAEFGEAGKSSANPLSFGSDYLKVKQDLLLKKAELQDLAEYLRPKHPRMTEKSEEIARQEKMLKIFREQSLEQLENKRSSAELQIQNLEQQMKEWNAKSLEISAKIAAFRNLQSTVERDQKLYDGLVTTIATLGIGTKNDPESVTILERASPSVLDRMNVAKGVLMGSLVGLVLSIGLLLVLDHFDDRPSSFTELQELFDEPILGQIPQEKLAGKNSSVQLLHENDNRHTFVEAYRNLRSSLLYMATEGKRPKIILVTSAIPGDGKSVTTANLAITMAQSGSRVLLVDADLRKGVLHKHFSVAPGPGFTETLSQGLDWKQAVQPTSTPSLSLLPRGGTSRSPGEMFLAQPTISFLQEAAQLYDYVLLDSAPVMAADDVTSLSPHVEGVLFVIRAGYTSARVAHAALELLYQREVDVLGFIFNGVQGHADEYYYYKYKDYYAVQPHT